MHPFLPVPVAPAPQHETIVAEDGFAVAVDRYQTSDDPRAVVVIAGAIGVPQRFYRHFAAFAQHSGYSAITLDYRGIGRSAPRSLRNFAADFLAWSRLDLAAVIESAAEEASTHRVPVYLVGHSFGGHAFGLLPNYDQVDACYLYGTGAGWHGWMPKREQLKVWALWHVVGPVLTRQKGYLPWSTIGMGEDLPLGVYHQWRRWCRYPRYFFDDPEIGAEMRAQFARVRVPLFAASAIDDRWSPPASRDAFLTGYANAAITRSDIDPAAYWCESLGHLGFFRPKSDWLWPGALEWLDAAYRQAGRSPSLPHLQVHS